MSRPDSEHQPSSPDSSGATPLGTPRSRLTFPQSGVISPALQQDQGISHRILDPMPVAPATGIGREAEDELSETVIPTDRRRDPTTVFPKHRQTGPAASGRVLSASPAVEVPGLDAETPAAGITRKDPLGQPRTERGVVLLNQAAGGQSDKDGTPPENAGAGNSITPDATPPAADAGDAGSKGPRPPLPPSGGDLTPRPNPGEPNEPDPHRAGAGQPAEASEPLTGAAMDALLRELADIVAARTQGAEGSKEELQTAVLTEELKRRIGAGEIPQGTRLPATRTLVTSLGVVNNRVIEKTRGALSDAGLVVARPRIGTEVSSQGADLTQTERVLEHLRGLSGGDAPSPTELSSQLGVSTATAARAINTLRARGEMAEAPSQLDTVLAYIRHLPPGRILPSQTDLSTNLEISDSTVTRAIEILNETGEVVGFQGVARFRASGTTEPSRLELERLAQLPSNRGIVLRILVSNHNRTDRRLPFPRELAQQLDIDPRDVQEAYNDLSRLGFAHGRSLVKKMPKMIGDEE